jgi:hypothetical protein
MVLPDIALQCGTARFSEPFRVEEIGGRRQLINQAIRQ